MDEQLMPGGATRRHVVVGIDGSVHSKAALRLAADMAQRTGAPIEAVLVWERPRAYGWDVAEIVGMDWAGEAQKALTEVVDEVFGPTRPSGLRTVAVEGDAAHQLIKRARGAELLVVGCRGRGGFAGLLLGSVSSKCAAHAPCPVLIVHPDDIPLESPSDTRQRQAKE
jgi:nucleotide-binding universal stress UspA family protein